MKLSKLMNLSRFLPSITILLAFIALAMGDGISLGSFDLGSLLSSFGGGHHKSAGFVKTHASIEESPEIGIGFQKIPIMIPLPTIILRKTKQLVAKGLTMPISCGGGCGGGGGGGGGYDGGMMAYGGGGGGGYGGGGGGYGGGGGGYGGGGY